MSARFRPYAAQATVSAAAVVIVAVVALTATSGAAVAAKSPKCGATITKDTTLRKDLVNCPNNGIVIGADGITLDLNGHSIDGDGRPAAGCDPQTEFCDTGVVNFGHDGVTVKHGSIHRFAAGLNVGKVHHNRLVGISARTRAVGVSLFNSSQTLIRGSSGNGVSGRNAFAGFAIFNSNHVRFLHNTIRRNRTDHGMVLFESIHNVIKGNRFSRNGGEGLLFESGDRNRIVGNRLRRNGAGITLGPGSRNLISQNFVTGGRDGIRIEKGHHNLVLDNLVEHTHRAGIRLGIRHPFIGGAHNVVRGNLVRASRADGFAVNRKERHSLLDLNAAKRSRDDGFDVRSRSATLTDNLALRNGDLGIAAVPGVNDGGGNVARGNGDPLQCINIFCG
jgi:parallel beta-helix repeat protein